MVQRNDRNVTLKLVLLIYGNFHIIDSVLILNIRAGLSVLLLDCSRYIVHNQLSEFINTGVASRDESLQKEPPVSTTQ